MGFSNGLAIKMVFIVIGAFIIALATFSMLFAESADTILFAIGTIIASILILWVLWIIYGEGDDSSTPVRKSGISLKQRGSSENGYRKIRSINSSKIKSNGTLDNNELVTDSEKPPYGKLGDTCRFCGELLPVDTLNCPACDKRRSSCPVCKTNININSKIAICPACRNEFHLAHLREVVKVTGRCAVCRSKIKRYEILVRRKLGE